jgi:hypothetical protein
MEFELLHTPVATAALYSHPFGQLNSGHARPPLADVFAGSIVAAPSRHQRSLKLPDGALWADPVIYVIRNRPAAQTNAFVSRDCAASLRACAASTLQVGRDGRAVARVVGVQVGARRDDAVNAIQHGGFQDDVLVLQR